jgi:hypothetical protein
MWLLAQRYDVYTADTGPKQFQVVEFDEFITDETVMIPSSSSYHQRGIS